MAREPRKNGYVIREPNQTTGCGRVTTQTARKSTITRHIAQMRSQLGPGFSDSSKSNCSHETPATRSRSRHPLLLVQTRLHHNPVTKENEMRATTYFYYMGDFVGYEYPSASGVRAYAYRTAKWSRSWGRVFFSGGRKAVKKRIRQSLRSRSVVLNPPFETNSPPCKNPALKAWRFSKTETPQ